MFCFIFDQEIMFNYLKKERKKDELYQIIRQVKQSNTIFTHRGERKINFEKNTSLNFKRKILFLNFD